MTLYPETAIFSRFTAARFRNLFCLENEISSLDRKLWSATGEAINTVGVTRNDHIFSAGWFDQHSKESKNPELLLVYRMRELLRQHSRFKLNSCAVRRRR